MSYQLPASDMAVYREGLLKRLREIDAEIQQLELEYGVTYKEYIDCGGKEEDV